MKEDEKEEQDTLKDIQKEKMAKIRQQERQTNSFRKVSPHTTPKSFLQTAARSTTREQDGTWVGKIDGVFDTISRI